MSLFLVQRKSDRKYAPGKSRKNNSEWKSEPGAGRVFKRNSDITQFAQAQGLSREQYDIVELKFNHDQPLPIEHNGKLTRTYRATKKMLHFLLNDIWTDKEFLTADEAERYIFEFCHKYNIHKDYFKIEEVPVQGQRKWDLRFLELAQFISGWSKDPSTQTGAVIVAPGREVIGVGYNGFARGVNDDEGRYADRDLKYKLVVHCERNAIMFADKGKLAGSTLYTYPFMSCSVCAGFVIQAGICRCVAPSLPADKAERWAEDMKLAQMQFKEAGVKLDIIPHEIYNAYAKG